MKRDDLYDLAAFAVVAEHRSFTRAAAELRMSQSALSHAMKALEDRLGVRLLARTTRSVSPTEAGTNLLLSLRPALADIWSGIDALSELRGSLSGAVRITATKHAASSVVMPVLPDFFAAYPGIRLEMVIGDDLTDIVSSGIDAGIRFGDIVEKDMIATRVGPDIQMAVVGAPSYFAKRPAPATPRQLSDHQCINYRLMKSGGFYAWDFEKSGKAFQTRVEGSLVFNNSDLLREAAIAGHGLAYVFEDAIAADVAAGRLVKILEDWVPLFPGYYVYHTSRRQTPATLAAFINAIRYRGARRLPGPRQPKKRHTRS